ncbi:hypothetical protein KAW48_05495, partial [candidate division WOR-3 bacterium]|nr:hypothetical protein [candidate division WOR-3 bacterium]
IECYRDKRSVLISANQCQKKGKGGDNFAFFNSFWHEWIRIINLYQSDMIGRDEAVPRLYSCLE